MHFLVASDCELCSWYGGETEAKETPLNLIIIDKAPEFRIIIELLLSKY